MRHTLGTLMVGLIILLGLNTHSAQAACSFVQKLTQGISCTPSKRPSARKSRRKVVTKKTRTQRSRGRKVRPVRKARSETRRPNIRSRYAAQRKVVGRQRLARRVYDRPTPAKRTSFRTGQRAPTTLAATTTIRVKAVVRTVTVKPRSPRPDTRVSNLRATRIVLPVRKPTNRQLVSAYAPGAQVQQKVSFVRPAAYIPTHVTPVARWRHQLAGTTWQNADTKALWTFKRNNTGHFLPTTGIKSRVWRWGHRVRSGQPRRLCLAGTVSELKNPKNCVYYKVHGRNRITFTVAKEGRKVVYNLILVEQAV